MTDNAKPFAFSQFVPGFDFLKSLTGGGSGGAVPGLPGLSNWVAPTLSVEELDKRISELKTVQYWLEQNGHALKATIQALEVQKMTLSTLKSMNVRMEDLANAFTRGTASAAAAMRDAATSVTAPAPAPAPAPEPAATPFWAAAAPVPAPEVEETEPTQAPADDEGAAGSGGAQKAAGAPAQGVVDTLQWWNSLTQQFQQIASNALQDAAQLRLPAVPGAPGKKTSPKSGASAPRKAAAKAAKPASPAASRSAKAAPAKPSGKSAAKSATARKPATRPR
ncbi:MAG: hypothetical protein EOO29_11150 [Comamonadaceae bacterium]|nr:MAG: hypothetical protein EOO29_11150 [Comamonadaceae bacterium]